MAGETAQQGRLGRDGTLDADDRDLGGAVDVSVPAVEFFGLGANGPAGRRAYRSEQATEARRTHVTVSRRNDYSLRSTPAER